MSAHPEAAEAVADDQPLSSGPGARPATSSNHTLGWRTVVAMVVLIPTVVVAIAAMFVSLAVDPEPHRVPLGVVAPPAASQAIESALAERAGDDAFVIEQFADADGARAAIERRDIAGAFTIGPDGVTVLTAEAGSAVLAQVVAATGTGIATAQSLPVTVESVVSTPETDARGTGFAAGLLPLLIAGMALGAAAAIALRGRVAMQLTVATLGPLVAGFGFAAVWSWLGVIDGGVGAVGLAAALMIGAIVWFTAGLGVLLGPAGVGVSALLMVLISNPLSGLASSPYLLPAPWGAVGQWLPPGAGGTLLRSVAYFPEAGIAGPVAILLGWVVAGAALLGLAALRQARTQAAVARG
ncbi:ABC transporter permease [Gordonia sp. zg691]|uniref:ABC transporter permease n=1 Tax=Gordonia jinghuaiqii TaxID=2758710 RepID=UPI00166253F4|nr:ABC transporter permease [Gordonia jinghuaiqii]MBD0860584.1 ABC transporter permease [Gordonia jinghuaiqii]